jgi:protein SOK2
LHQLYSRHHHNMNTATMSTSSGMANATDSGIYYQGHMQSGQQMPNSQQMSNGQPPAPQTVTSGPMAHYNGPSSLMHPSPHAYANSASYGGHNYYNGLTSPPTPQQTNMGGPPSMHGPTSMSVPGSMHGPPSLHSAANVLPLPGVQGGPMSPNYSGFDTTGQVAPHGTKPRVTATLWEDEGSLCFQVETRGICVARREDNHMINGTKLLNVAGMTRGRRDGILKSEKTRHVVKIGPMHLKGVWIPYERALDFANKEKITEALYPLFVHNISALLYHPQNQARGTAGGLADRRRPAPHGIPPSLPSIGSHHHHSMQALPAPPTPVGSHSSVRPSMDRAHTFPTPPTSATTVMDGMGSGGYHWPQSGAMAASQSAIDQSLGSARSLPSTPAVTPPAHNMATMSSYGSGQGYDSSRGVYGAPAAAQQSPYASQSAQNRAAVYAQQDAYVKGEMHAPPSRAGGAEDADNAEKPTGAVLQSNGTAPAVGHGSAAGEDDGEQEHDAEYTHNSDPYDSSRTAYNFSASSVDHSHMSNEMTSPNHGVGSGRATPRTAVQPSSYYTQPGGYSSPTRVGQSSSVYNVMNDRGATSGSDATNVYGPSADLSGSLAGNYGSPLGQTSSLKRGRDDDDEQSRSTEGAGGDFNKRRRTLETRARR